MKCTIEQMIKNLESLYTEIKSPLVDQLVPPLIDKMRIVRAANSIELNNGFQEYFDGVLTPFNKNAAAQDVLQVNVVSSLNTGYQDLSNFNAADVVFEGTRYTSIEVAFQVIKAEDVVKNNPTEANKAILRLLKTLQLPTEKDIIAPTEKTVAMIEISKEHADKINKAISEVNGKVVDVPIEEGINTQPIKTTITEGNKHVATISKLAKLAAGYLQGRGDTDRVKLLDTIVTEYYAGSNPTETSLWGKKLLLDTGVDGKVGGFAHNDESIRDHWAMTFPTLLYKAREQLRNNGAEVTNGEMANSIKEARADYAVEAELTGRPNFDALPFYKKGQKTMRYAGIGSRKTPPEVLKKMTEIANYLSRGGYTLQTGYKHRKGRQIVEEGADQAFSMGTERKELFGPEDANDMTRAIANEVHPGMEGMKNSVRTRALENGRSSADADKAAQIAENLQARNTFQVFGRDLNSPVDFVLFYAKEDPRNKLRPKGGTGQAVEMARRKGIPTINMAVPGWESKLRAVLGLEAAKATSVNSDEELDIKDCK